LASLTEEQLPNSGGIRPLERLGAIAAVVIFTWYAQKGFRALIDAVS
jgi:hypothetical protein